MRKRTIAGGFALVIFAATGAFAQGHWAFLSSTAHSAQFLALSAQQSSTQTPAAEQPARIRVGANVMTAKLAHQVLPVYPEIAKTAHIRGTVVLHAIIGKDGSVQQLQFVSGPPLLMRSAMVAVRQWQYEPTLLNGEPVEVDTTVSVVFTLGEDPTPEPPPGTSPQPEIPSTSATIQPLRLIHQEMPVYPPDAKEKHIEGSVLINAVVSSEGSIKQLEFVSGPLELKDAAIDAVGQWQYRPMQVNGRTLEAHIRIAVLFSLTKNNYKAVAETDYPIAAEVFALPADVPPPQHPTAARTGQPPIPDTLEGIQRQTEEVFEAWRTGNQGGFQELLEGFAIEDPAAWLTGTFGAQQGPALVPDYEISLEKFKRHMARIAGYWEKSTTSALRVEYSAAPALPDEAGQPDGPPAPVQSLKIENFRFYVTTGQVDPGDWVFSFVYAGGAFRIVGGTHTFWNENWRLKHSEAVDSAVSISLANSAGPADYSREPVLYEQVRGKMRYENDGTGMREVMARLRVQTPAGLAKAGQLIFDYNAANERIEIRSIHVVKPDGSVISAGPSAVQDLSAPVAREAPMYTDARQQYVTVPGVAVGDTIEYDVVTTTFEPLLPGQFSQTWKFVADAISLDEQVDLNVPRERPLKLKSPLGLEPTVHDEGDRRIYHWAASTLQYSSPNELTKNFKFDVKALLEGVRAPATRAIMFSTFQTWDEIGTWYSHLEHDRRVPTPEIRAQADEIVHGQTIDVEKVQALYEWVSRNIRYVSLSFGVGRYQPHSAIDVLQNRYGDCKDKTTLLEAFLEAEGFHGSPVLINSLANIDPDVPTPHQFDHVFTFVSVAGHDYWLDPTIGVGPFGYLLPQLRGKSALVASADLPSRLRKTPQDLPDPTLYQLDVEGSMSDDRKLDAKFSFETRGDLEVLLRMGFLQVSPGQLAAIMQNAANGAVAAQKGQSDISFSDLKAGDPTDTRSPFHMELRIKGTIPETKQVNQTPSTQSREQTTAQLGEMLVYLLPGVETKLDSKGKLEQQAVKLQGPKEYALNVAFTTPAAKTATTEKPVHVAISKDFAEFKADVVRDDQSLRGKWLLNLRTPEVPASQAKDYAEFVQDVTDSFGSVIPIPAYVPQPSGAQDVYQTGLKAFSKRDYKTAQQQFESAVEKDPNFGAAWNDLGRTYMNLGLLDKAAEAFHKAIAVTPDNKFAYNNLGLILWRQQKYDEAIKSFQRQIEVAPRDRYAHNNLGQLYLELEKYDLAEKELDIASSIDGNSADVQVSLGRVYLGLNEPDKARQSFDRALELSPTALIWNNVAYYMSLKKVDLDRAKNYAESAVSATSSLLRNISLDHLSMTDVGQNSLIASYWDTLGWIQFQRGDFPQAEKYVTSAWTLRETSDVGDQLAQIYEKEGRTSDAIQQYELALAAYRPLPEARQRLAALLGSDRKIDSQVAAAGSKLAARRTVKLPNSDSEKGDAEFWVLFSSGKPIPDVRFISGDEKMRAFTDEIQTAKFPPMFPDATDTKLLRRGILSCSHLTTECTFVLFSTEDVHSVD